MTLRWPCGGHDDYSGSLHFYWHRGDVRRKGATIVSLYAVAGGAVVCLGYNLFYFEAFLPNGTVGQILDILDYLSNNCIMPLIALFTCIFIGWIVSPQVIIDEATQGRYKFSRKRLYVVMIKFVAPVLLFVLLLQSVGVLACFGKG